MAHDTYISPFQTRYASKEMQYIFSEDNKFKTWRRLWIALAKAEQKQGLPITDAQIAELEAHKDDINYDVAAAREKECRHDVMSHVYAYGVQCPEAKGIIHLGATSCYVGDNTDILVMREALEVVRRKLLNVMALLAEFADEYKAMPALAYTHLQPAQLTTVGKRAALWLGELYMDYAEIETRIKGLALLGSKGTTGTQWFERTLDDSANKRVAVAEGFLAVDAILNIMLNVCDGLVVYPKVIRSRIMAELPFMASENIMMSAVKKGGDRQELHEKIRVYAQQAAKVVKEEGGKNDLIERICADSSFGLDYEEIEAILKPEDFTGRSAAQVEEFLADCIRPLLEENRALLGEKAELSV